MRASLAFVILAVSALAILLVFNGGEGIGAFSADEIAQGGYLAILGIVLVSSGLAASRANVPKALKAAGIWIAVFAVLIGLYAYRLEFQAIGDRMLAELVPGRTVTLAGADRATELINRADDRHFHVTATIDDKPIRFLVDTGASMVAIDRATASSLGFDPETLAFTNLVQTANGTARSATITLPSVTIGTIERRNVRAAVMDAGGDGINLLGLSFLGTLSSVEFQGQRLVLRD